MTKCSRIFLLLILLANSEHLFALDEGIQLGVGSEYRLGVYSPTINLYHEGIDRKDNISVSLGMSHSKLNTDVYAGGVAPGYKVDSATSLFAGIKFLGDNLSPYIQIGRTLDIVEEALFGSCSDSAGNPCKYYGVSTLTLGVSKDNKYADISLYYRQYHMDSNNYGVVRADVLGISVAFNII